MLKKDSINSLDEALRLRPKHLQNEIRIIPKIVNRGEHRKRENVAPIIELYPSPSTYIKERKMSITDRLCECASNLSAPKIVELVDPNDILKPSVLPIDTPIFQPFPSQIILQNYIPFQKYEVVVSFRNSDKVFFLFFF